MLSISRAHALEMVFISDFAWDAPHVVTVNGTGRVIESFKGDLRKGDIVDLKHLRIPTSVPVINTKTEKAERITSDRLFLLLQKSKNFYEFFAPNFLNSKQGTAILSMVWFHKGIVYSYGQRNIPGPVQLLPTGDETQFRQGILNTQKALRIATKTPLKKRAQALVMFMKTHAHWKEIYQAREETLKALSRCGQSGITVFPALFNDDKLTCFYNEVARSFINAVGVKSAPTFTAIVKQELVFWRKTAPTMPVGTLNNAAGKGYSYQQYQNLQTHFNRLQAALNGLRHFRYPPGKRSAMQTLALWRSLPQLEAQRRGPITASCEMILKRLSP